MQVLFIVLILVFLAVALFALQNPAVVTVRFWPWEFQTSVAVLILGATTAGALVGWTLGLAGRLLRWQRTRAAASVTAPEPKVPTEPPPGS